MLRIRGLCPWANVSDLKERLRRTTYILLCSCAGGFFEAPRGAGCTGEAAALKRDTKMRRQGKFPAFGAFPKCCAA